MLVFISYNTMVSACENEAQPKQASKPLIEMQRDRRKLNVISYSAAISACEMRRSPNKRLSRCTVQHKLMELKAVIYNATNGVYVVRLREIDTHTELNAISYNNPNSA